MAVERISKRALQQLLSGKIREEKADVVIKFYKNDCHYCHALSSFYDQLSEEEEDTHFFAFNIDDYPEAEKILNFKGVPTICILNISRHSPRVRVMSDPSNPDNETWYKPQDIRKFIEQEKQK